MRNKPLPGMMKRSPMKQHETRPLTENEKKTLKHGKGGSAPNPAKTAASMYKGAKRLYKKITNK